MSHPDEWYWARGLRTPHEEARDALIAKVKTGELTDGAAQTEANRQGLGNLESEPDHSLHDPTKKAMWSLSMIIAWIMTRDLDWVREQDADFLRECLRWQTIENGPGRMLATPPHPNCPLLEMHMFLEGRRDEFKAARADLIAKLSAGDIRATCLRWSWSVSPEPIERVEWQFSPIHSHNGHDRLGGISTTDSGCRDIRLWSDEVLVLWPAEYRAKPVAGADLDLSGYPSAGRPRGSTLNPKQIRAIELEFTPRPDRAPPTITADGDKIKWRVPTKAIADMLSVRIRTVQGWRDAKKNPHYSAAVLARIRERDGRK